MDESQDAIAEVVVSLLERESARDIALWPALLSSGLLSAALPQRYGGEGLGLFEVSAMLTELATDAVQVPALSTLGFGILPLLRTAPDVLVDKLFPAVAKGAVLTAALNEPGAPLSTKPETIAVTSGNTVKISGHKVGVLYANLAKWVLVPTDSGLAVVDTELPGIVRAENPSSIGVPEFSLHLDNVPIPAGQLLPDGILPLNRLASALIGSVADGLLRGALRRTAEHVRAEYQLGRPPTRFYEASRQIADIHTTARALRSRSLSANWALAQEDDSPEHYERVDAELNVLAYWVATRLPEAMQKCYRISGGIGAETTSPLHRYYSQAENLARMLGSTSSRPGRPDTRRSSPQLQTQGTAHSLVGSESMATSVTAF